MYILHVAYDIRMKRMYVISTLEMIHAATFTEFEQVAHVSFFILYV